MIDAGKTREKVDHPDPAIAPLGTDEEAGGAQTSPEAIADSAEKRPVGDQASSRGPPEDRASDDGDATERERK